MGSPKEIPLSEKERLAISQQLCDGVPRFSVDGENGLTYSQAWETLFRVTRCSVSFEKDGKKNRTFSRKGIKRLGELNRRYMGIARLWLLDQWAKEKAKPAPEPIPENAPAAPEQQPEPVTP